MAELEIDQSNLPRVQEVRQCFAVLEDGALAHNLQEQEIEQYYTANVQKSQLVQNDIRIARRLQDEERDQLQHVSRQREEQDSEYARLIQEELCRGAEEAHRREQEDQQIAKRIQEEEECYARRRPGSHASANRGVPARGRAPPLAMGELQQVLLDEELARRLQEEEGVTTRSPRASSPPRRTCVDGDFRVAQVAQDEEIARFIQKQEMRSGHGWEEADASGGSSPDAGEACMGAPRDWRAARHRQQRERLDSQGLPSPPEDYPPDDPPSSPVAMALQHPPLRNIAEDLDPTFQAKRSANVRTGNTDAVSQDHPPHQTQQGGYGGREETNFVPPTKRPNEKLGATKAKEKKENSKQKENCKQQ